MVLGGLWHGASWNFVIWGALHGVALAGTRIWQRRFGDGKPTGLWRVAATLLTFHYVCFAWIFFRAPTFAHAKLVCARVGHLTWGTTNLSGPILGVLALGVVTHWISDEWLDDIRERFARTPALVQGIVLAIAALALHAAASTGAQPFVYGQF
jgi:hypothetical protein